MSAQDAALTTITYWEVTMAASSILDWENLEDDSRYIYEALARLEFGEFSTLTIADQSLLLALALHYKNSHRLSEIHQS